MSEAARDLATSRFWPYLEQEGTLTFGSGRPRDCARMTPDTTNNPETLRQIMIKVQIVGWVVYLLEQQLNTVSPRIVRLDGSGWQARDGPRRLTSPPQQLEHLDQLERPNGKPSAGEGSAAAPGGSGEGLRQRR